MAGRLGMDKPNMWGLERSLTSFDQDRQIRNPTRTQEKRDGKCR